MTFARLLLPLAALLSVTPAMAEEVAPPAQPPQVSLEQRMLLRCSAAFALVANRQGQGEAWAQAYPPLGETGREFFVRASAQLLDETGMDTGQLEALLRGEAEALLDRDLLDGVMPVCLGLLPPAVAAH